MNKTILLLLLGFSTLSCETGTNVSFQKDLLSNVTTKGNGLSCEKVVILVDGEVAKSNEIIYGQKIEFKFKNTEGFNVQKGLAYPGLRMSVFSKNGDTIVNYQDLYEEYKEKGFNVSLNNLFAELTVASPISSDNEYEIEVFIWDKKGKGKYQMNYDFSLVSDPKINNKNSGIKAQEIYLFSKDNKKVVTDHIINKKEEITLFLEGIEGFSVHEGLVYPGFFAKITDANNVLVLDNKDLFERFTADGVDAKDFAEQIFMNFNVSGKDLKGPVSVSCKLWDKKSDKFLELEMKCEVKD